MHTNLKAVAPATANPFDALYVSNFQVKALSASAFATAIYPKAGNWESLTWEQRCDILYDIIEQLLFSDEQKADLYARLAEQLDAKTEFNTAVRIIKRALHTCQYLG